VAIPHPLVSSSFVTTVTIELNELFEMTTTINLLMTIIYMIKRTRGSSTRDTRIYKQFGKQNYWKKYKKTKNFKVW
jgi:hypothetical protein